LTRDVLTEVENLEKICPELGEVTAFELVTAMAFLFFAKEGSDLAVIEVGMGGTLDATNVVDPVVSVITALDYEHTRVLGSTLAEIAANKAGIIKQGRTVVSLAQEPESLHVIEKTARKKQSRLLLAGRDWTASGNWQDFEVSTPWGRFEQLRASLPGDHQVQNAGAAVVSILLLNNFGGEVSETTIREGLASAVWPGRYEIVHQPGHPKIILDGAHTPASARAFAQAVLAEVANQNRAVVIGMMADKDPGEFARELAVLNAPFIVTASKSPRAAPIRLVRAGVETAGLQAGSASDVQSALSATSKVVGLQGTVIVTGSLAIVAEAREALGIAASDPAVDDEAFAETGIVHE
jgi:dihydrofolate synthase / folylpolyglutamate synthase